MCNHSNERFGWVIYSNCTPCVITEKNSFLCFFACILKWFWTEKQRWRIQLSSVSCKFTRHWAASLLTVSKCSLSKWVIKWIFLCLIFLCVYFSPPKMDIIKESSETTPQNSIIWWNFYKWEKLILVENAMVTCDMNAKVIKVGQNVIFFRLNRVFSKTRSLVWSDIVTTKEQPMTTRWYGLCL